MLGGRLIHHHRIAVAWMAAVIILVLTIVADRGQGYTHYDLGGQPVVWVGAQSIRYLSPSTFPHDSIPEQLALEAMGLWNIIPGCDFTYSYARLNDDPPIDHFDGYNDMAAVPANQLDPGVLGVTFLINDGPNWFDMDILFSDDPEGVGYSFEFNPDCLEVSEPEPVNGFSFLLVAVHELGHALGLAHSPIGNEPAGTPWFIATMNPRYPTGAPVGQEHIIEIHADDRSGARFLYPHTGPAEPPQTDLAVPEFAAGPLLGSAEPLWFSPATLFPGASVDAVSVIENFGTTNALFVSQGFYLSTDDLIASTDTPLGTLRWDLAAGDGIQFNVDIPLPSDLPAGSYYLGSILDDLQEITEVYEDNNAARYCDALVVSQLTPVVVPPGQQNISCNASYLGPQPSVTHPLNMAPLTWSLETGPAGMVVDPANGEPSWPVPIWSPFPYAVTLKAANGAGTGTAQFLLGVLPEAPEVTLPPEHVTSCTPGYTGPVPTLFLPHCTGPILDWTLVSGPPDMDIDSTTGVVTWDRPQPSTSPYLVRVRATGLAGNDTASFLLYAWAGDFDGSGQVSRLESASSAQCLDGPDVPSVDGCTCADADGDGDVDLFDYSLILPAAQP